MLYFYSVKETKEGFVGYVEDVDLETQPQPTREEAVLAVKQGFSGYIELVYRRNRKPIPLPKKRPLEGEAFYAPIKLQLRILLWNAMMEKHISQKELAEKLKVSPQQVQQLVSGKGATSVEKYEEILQMLGCYPDVNLISE